VTAGAPVRDPLADHRLTPQNDAVADVIEIVLTERLLRA
jgi:hypothetical protein